MKLHRLVLCTVVVFFFFLSGCGGPKTRKVEGTVTYDGQLLKVGSIAFVPGKELIEKGTPSSFADIKDGKFVTLKSMGIVAGNYEIVVNGFDGIAVDDSPEGSLIFENYRTPHTFVDSGDVVLDIDIPLIGKKRK